MNRREGRALLLKVGEVFLKGGTRERFLRALHDNLRAALDDVPGARIYRRHGYLLVRLPEGAPAADEALALARLQRVFGLVSVTPARTFPPDAPLASVAQAAVAEAEDGVARAGRDDLRFRLTIKRPEKRYPANTQAIIEAVAGAIHERFPRFSVDLERYDWEGRVEVRETGVFVSSRRLPGAGGLPVGASAPLTLMLSGGIDSPVAALLGMKRGCRVRGITFDSFPLIGREARAKVETIASVLAGVQGRFELTVVPFADIQKMLKRRAPTRELVLLYRRSMYRMAERFMRAKGDAALLTGDNLGQVASQTVPNLVCLDAAVDALVVRPLIAFDKQETIAISRAWGLFEASTSVSEDPCSLFMPKHPQLAGKPDFLAKVEERLADELPALEDAALAAADTLWAPPRRV